MAKSEIDYYYFTDIVSKTHIAANGCEKEIIDIIKENMLNQQTMKHVFAGSDYLSM